MVRPIIGERWRCGGRWTEARFRSFITSALRQASRRWAPVSDAKKRANVKRGFYLCNGCHETVPASVKVEGVRKTNIFVDHIDPVVDPTIGFENWDKYIEKMFCEEDNLQVLCGTCHDKKSMREREAAKQRRAYDRELRKTKEC